MNVRICILVKNEIDNLKRSLPILNELGVEIFIFDSGSSDGSMEFSEEFDNVCVIERGYKSHYETYNFITNSFFDSLSGFVLILDADMTLSDDLKKFISSGDFNKDVYSSKVKMCVDGRLVRYGSLYPHKPFMFRLGDAYFVESGHGERVGDQFPVSLAPGWIVHDDRKGYSEFIASQVRYGKSLHQRFTYGSVTGRDKFRVKYPFLIFLIPLYSYLLKGGLFSGRSGINYALDRLIAEAIMHRISSSAECVNNDAA